MEVLQVFFMEFGHRFFLRRHHSFNLVLSDSFWRGELFFVDSLWNSLASWFFWGVSEIYAYSDFFFFYFSKRSLGLKVQVITLLSFSILCLLEAGVLCLHSLYIRLLNFLSFFLSSFYCFSSFFVYIPQMPRGGLLPMVVPRQFPFPFFLILQALGNFLLRSVALD